MGIRETIEEAIRQYLYETGPQRRHGEEDPDPREITAMMLSAIAKAGRQIVPVEPTEAMLSAAESQLDWGPGASHCYDDAPQGEAQPSKVWTVMIEAAKASGKA